MGRFMMGYGCYGGDGPRRRTSEEERETFISSLGDGEMELG